MNILLKWYLNFLPSLLEVTKEMVYGGGREKTFSTRMVSLTQSKVLSLTRCNYVHLTDGNSYADRLSGREEKK